ncbi:TetR/AcrR family transcriptional regulator [Georgenia subflava]|uniref:TetR family transcriptional regulator n=1 Tax=Georgenia subflava TaxID=1622177 RepID=A0A6N7EE69_9MICO|nr:TetR family transcriptional regulator C-terminal domain-containing protein [Georgenia subflava]MPV35631.1 TetR family transcriptional regulator [Georgenia subflava]
MPKLVDPAARRREVGEAVLRVVGARGVEGASFGAIAEEANLAIGSVRNYFPNHDAVLLFAMQELADRVTDRLRRRLESIAELDVDLATVEEILAELLPVNEHRRLEADVWLAFVAATRTRPVLAEVARKAGSGIRTVVGHVLAGAQRRGLLRVEDPVVETERLASLLDGLTIATIRPPGISAATAREVLRRHLESLT